MNEHFRVVCGTCNCEPGLMLDADEEVAVCPGCGQRDGVDEAFRIACEHNELRDVTLQHMPPTGQTFRWHSVDF